MSPANPLVGSKVVSSVSEAPPRAATSDRESPSTAGLWRVPSGNAALGLALAIALVALAFLSRGGVDETVATSGNTWTNIALTLLGAIGTAIAVVAARPGRRFGLVAIALMAALTALEAASIAWSVLPDSSWLATNQQLAYLAMFTLAATMARNVPQRWPALLGGVATAFGALCGWSLLVKVFPATLAAGNQTGRLQAPFGYWNAIGLTAALGLPVCLYLGARRDRGRTLAALTAPAIALMIAVLVLSYSRSADLAAIVGVALWMAFVPLRLRAVAMLAVGLLGGAVIGIWGLTHHALSHDLVAPAAQDASGHTFGIVLVVVVLGCAGAGLAVSRAADRIAVPASARRRCGAVLLALAALIPVAAIVALAASPRGLTGEISHGWHELTSTTATSGDTAGRVLAVGNSRPVYWHEAIAVGKQSLFKGVGELGFAAAHLRHTVDPTVVNQAHSFVFETFADLGLLGLVLIAALLGAWLTATWRTLAPKTPRGGLGPRRAAEREGLITLAVLVVVFGVQSTLDWTWYFAGITVPVLLCAGWLAGRGPVSEVTEEAAVQPSPHRSLLDRPAAAATVLLVLAVALLGAWMQWQPLRSAQQITDAENAASGTQAFALANAARSSDPLSLYPRQLLSALYAGAHQPARARAELVGGTRQQPDNPDAWSALAQYDARTGAKRDAVYDLYRVINLDHAPDPRRVAAIAQINKLQAELAAPGSAGG